MSLEIDHSNKNHTGRQYCGPCFVVAENPNVLAGGPIMVSTGSETDRVTNLGSSTNFGNVVVAVPLAASYVGKDGRVHLMVPIATATEFREKIISRGRVVFNIADAHDLKPLP